MRVLLIGNGPAALAKKMGAEIDAFDGKVVRFNTYATKGFEDWVGTRTDWWVTCGNPPVEEHEKRFFNSWREDAKTMRSVKRYGASLISRETLLRTVTAMGFNHPSSGAVFTNFCLERGIEVWLWGFDFLNPRLEHHYNKDVQPRGSWHDVMAERNYFYQLADKGKVRWFGVDDTETGPIVRWPVPCGKDDDVSWYREPAHDAWYRWFGERCKGKKVLDVGCGVGKGMETLLQAGAATVEGQDVDPRLSKPGVHIQELRKFKNKSFDIVTCVDVIEHVVADKFFVEQMRRIARETICITTPCFVRSMCGNIAHCREYTIPQFVNLFQPDEVWSASPDGSIHLTKLLSKAGENCYSDFRRQGPDNKNQDAPVPVCKNVLPLNMKFNNTVDGEEWAHVCGIFRLGSAKDDHALSEEE